MTFSVKRRRVKYAGGKKTAFPLFLSILALVVSLLTGLSGAVRRQFYFYRRPEGVIWGLTAELLTEFLRLLQDGEREAGIWERE